MGGRVRRRAVLPADPGRRRGRGRGRPFASSARSRRTRTSASSTTATSRPSTACSCPDRMPYTRIYRTTEIPQLLEDFERHLRAEGWEGEPLRLARANQTPLKPIPSLFVPDVLDASRSLYREDFEAFGYDDPLPGGIDPSDTYDPASIAEVGRLIERAQRIHDLHNAGARSSTSSCARRRPSASRPPLLSGEPCSGSPGGCGGGWSAADERQPRLGGAAGEPAAWSDSAAEVVHSRIATVGNPTRPLGASTRAYRDFDNPNAAWGCLHAHTVNNQPHGNPGEYRPHHRTVLAPPHGRPTRSAAASHQPRCVERRSRRASGHTRPRTPAGIRRQPAITARRASPAASLASSSAGLDTAQLHLAGRRSGRRRRRHVGGAGQVLQRVDHGRRGGCRGSAGRRRAPSARASPGRPSRSRGTPPSGSEAPSAATAGGPPPSSGRHL